MENSLLGINILLVQKSIEKINFFEELFYSCSVRIRQICHAHTLKTALRSLKQTIPDIVFLEFELGDESGISVFTSIQAQNREVPIVILDSGRFSKLAIQAINQGAQDFLVTDELDEKVLSKAIVYSIERKRISESLMLSDERYKLVSKATSDMVWDWDLLKNKVYRNKNSWDRLFGSEADDSKMVDSWWDRIHPADRKQVSLNIDHILNNKNVENFEIQCRVIRNNGTFAYIIDRGYAIRNEDGEAIRLVGVTQNVTEQKESEEKLRASEQRFRSIIEKSNEGLLLVKADGGAIDMSESGKKILGHSGKLDTDLIRKNLVFSNGEDVLNDYFNDVIKKYGRVKVYEFRYRRPDNTEIWLEATFHNLLNVSSLQAVVIHFRDISFRKIFEDGLKLSEEKYRNLFNVNPSTIIISDPSDHSIIEVNDAATREIGYSRKDFLKLKTTDLIPAGEQKKLSSIALKMLKIKQYQAQTLWMVVTSKGTIKYFQATSRAIDYYGKLVTLTIANNISEKIELEKKLGEQRLKTQNEITTAVITAQEQERELLGKELHDNINQILVTTKLYIEYALTNESIRDSLLVSAKEFVTTAMEELRNLSKSLLPPSLGEVGLLMALDELVESIQLVNKFRLITSWGNLDEDQLSDKLKLTIFRIVQEQLANVIKHANAKNVWIKIKLENRRLALIIKDDGIGLKVLDRHPGVGFKNIRSRAELHGGTMKLTSEKNKGCTLSLKFNL